MTDLYRRRSDLFLNRRPRTGINDPRSEIDSTTEVQLQETKCNSAVVLMARAPWAGGKTRVRIAGGESRHAELRHALFRDTLDVVSSVPNTAPIVACDPPEAAGRMREYLDGEVGVMAQRGAGLGDRLAHVFEDAFNLGAASVVVVGSDLPDLPTRPVEEALESLAGHRSRVVVGPATDGGYYLIGMNRPNPSLFEGIDWGTSRVLDQTLAATANLRVVVCLLEPWRDVDSVPDLADLKHHAGAGAPRTRAWLRRFAIEEGQT